MDIRVKRKELDKVNYNRDCRNNSLDDRHSFRLTTEDLQKLDTIAKHNFGTADRMRTTTIKMLIEKEYREVKIEEGKK